MKARRRPATRSTRRSRSGSAGATRCTSTWRSIRGTPRNTPAVLAFLAAWTSRLHAQGYKAGVYSNADSGISDLVAARGTGLTEPDDIWIAEWNGAQSTSSPYVASRDWGGHQRLHQSEGGHGDPRWGPDERR
ncbi:MAG: DUF1906 domain-containing protein [Solirubrobacterales bacterium]|nr:DUF1906 domain-containing protein [Solirubrobacterales bacterium]